MSETRSIEGVLRKDIVSGVFAPSSKLRMDALKERYRVGYSPIREALSRLVGDGLVSFEHNKGFAVVPLSLEDLEDIATTRIAIECKAFELSIERGDDRWEANLVAAMYRYRQKSKAVFADEASRRDWLNAHDELHNALISACGSPRLKAQQIRLLEQHNRYLRLAMQPDLPEEAHIEEHETLVELALARETGQAVARLEHHMMITADILRGSDILGE